MIELYWSKKYIPVKHDFDDDFDECEEGILNRDGLRRVKGAQEEGTSCRYSNASLSISAINTAFVA
jgi:hypothetical protein